MTAPSANVRKYVQKMLSLNGFTAKADAIMYLVTQLEPLNEERRKIWMDKITNHLRQMDCLLVSKDHMEKCVDECTKKNQSSEPVFNVINAFEIPCIMYSCDKRAFIKSDTPRQLFPSADSKAKIYRRRYDILLQRTLSIDKFKKNEALKNAEWFLCSSGRIENTFILGLLIQRSDGHFDLEDVTGCIKLNLSNCKFEDGIFIEHCFVLINGLYEDGVMNVTSIEQPPALSIKESFNYFGNLNTFGGPAEISLRTSQTLKMTLSSNPDAAIIFLSDVWLDDLTVLRRLKLLFDGYSDQPPIAFVLMGNFISTQNGSIYAQNLKLGFRNFVDLLSKYPVLCNRTNFIFVPGPCDLGSPLIFPRSPVPNVLAEELIQKIPHLYLASNPCRIQYCTREIVVFREDLLTKFWRNAIYYPKTDDLPKMFAKTLISQGTLAPTTLHLCPIYWNYCHSMDLYPLPDLVVVGEQYEFFSEVHSECRVYNPGSFKKGDFRYQMYRPASNDIEDCGCIMDEND